MTESANISYVSPLLTASAAHPALSGATEFQTEFQGETRLDCAGVAWHYGAPLVEQAAIHAGNVFVDRSQRRVIEVTGDDAPEFLNNLFSQKLDALTAESTSALDLDMQGRILHHLDITRTAKGYFIDVPAAQADSLLTFLQRMVFWSQVTIAERDLSLISLMGPDIADQAIPAGISPVFSRFLARPDRIDIAVARPALAAAARMLSDAGFRPVGLMAYTAERVRALAPEKDADLDTSSIPHEVEHWVHGELAESAVHLNKGCYRGQETVARVENLGRSPRALVLLHLDGSAPTRPEIGADITLNGRKVGRLGTLIDDCDFGPIALALIKRSALGAGPAGGGAASASAPGAPATQPVAIDVQIGNVSARVDPDSLPREEGPKAGRLAQSKLRGK